MRNTQNRQCKTFVLAMLLSFPLILALKETGSGVETVQSVRKQSGKPRTIVLDKDLLQVTDPTDDTTKDVRVVLTEQEYDVVLKKKMADTTVSDWSRTMLCYELCSAKGDVPYSRAIWSFRPLAGFRLFAHGEGDTYLAWIRGWSVVFMEVSDSKSKTVGLFEYVATKEKRIVVPVGDIVGRKHFEGLDAFNSDMDILFVGKDKSGFLRVKVRGPRTGKTFEFGWDGKVWKLIDGSQ